MPRTAKIDLPDRYRVVRHIASGGMASVWEAEDLLLGRVVAVKALAAHFAADPGARERFQREARTAARVSDQTHVVTIYDIGEHGDEAFIVMEHFAGGTVADRLRDARDAGERIPRDTALRWLREAAAGLDVAHAAGIVHRDVKPANLLLDSRDRLAVGDFGIARLADDAQMTMTGQVLGTAAYISPEQALGRPAEPASDRYALALVAHELLTGSRPFAGGPPAAQARQHAEARPTPASCSEPGLPAALDAVLARGLAKDPADRPRTASELVGAIESALRERPRIEPTRPFAAAPLSGRTRVTPLRPGPPPAAAGPLGVAGAGGAGAGGAGAGVAGAGVAGAGVARAGGAGAGVAGAGVAGAGVAGAGVAGAGARTVAPARRRGPWPALLGVALLTGATVGLVLALSGGGSEPDREVAGISAQTPAGSQRSSTATNAAAAPQPPPAPPPQPAASGDADPSALNDRGYALLKQGRYGEAIEPLRASVAGYAAAGEGGLPYAFALFNLAVALNRSGNPADAVPLLRERLKFDNQRETVQAELDDALAKLGEAAPAKEKKPHKQKRDKDGG